MWWVRLYVGLGRVSILDPFLFPRPGREWSGIYPSHHGQWQRRLHWQRRADSGRRRWRHIMWNSQTETKDGHYGRDILCWMRSSSKGCFCFLCPFFPLKTLVNIMRQMCYKECLEQTHSSLLPIIAFVCGHQQRSRDNLVAN